MIKNIDAWKNQMKSFSKKHNLDIQEVYQRFILEEFARIISASSYKDKLVFKGGFVVSTILGFDTRMTRDIDLTYQSSILYEQDIETFIQNIIDTQFDSVFDYSLSNFKTILSNDDYPSYTVTLNATLQNTIFKLKLDISNNTLIFPKAINSYLTSLFSDEKISVYTYYLENIIAEKFETTLDRGEFNGRMRDLFDIFFLYTTFRHRIDDSILSSSILKVSNDRGTLQNLELYDEITNNLRQSTIFSNNFINYKKNQYPNQIITLEDVFKEFDSIYSLVNTKNSENENNSF